MVAFKTFLSMAFLKWMRFFAMCLLALMFMIWSENKIMKVLNKQEHTNSMYFYKQEPVYKQNFVFTLRERLKCENDTFLVILVTSRPTAGKARQAIRQSWGSKNMWWGKQVLTLFLLGQAKEGDGKSSLSIKEESILYGDIIQQDFLDTYHNLTLKTIMAFRWVTEFCSSAQYVMKTDSDVFINTGNLVNYLVNSNATENFFTGYPLIEIHCIRNIHEKSYVSHKEYPFKIFPPYCSGTGYVLDSRLAQKVYRMMAHVKPIRFEDVYVGVCLNLLHVNISFPNDIELFFIERIDFNICKFKHLITAHKVNPDEMIVFWDGITRNFSLPCD